MFCCRDSIFFFFVSRWRVEMWMLLRVFIQQYIIARTSNFFLASPTNFALPACSVQARHVPASAAAAQESYIRWETIGSSTYDSLLNTPALSLWSGQFSALCPINSPAQQHRTLLNMNFFALFFFSVFFRFRTAPRSGSCSSRLYEHSYVTRTTTYRSIGFRSRSYGSVRTGAPKSHILSYQ